MSKAIFKSFAQNNLWSNYRLHNACAQLSEQEYRAQRASFFGSIHHTLNHILIVDLIYQGRLTTQQLVSLECEELETTLANLTQQQKRADQQLIEFVTNLDDDELESTVFFTRLNGQQYSEIVSNLLMHLFTHQIHHRGQIHDMLSQTSTPPPQLDEFFLDGDLELRVNELAKLELPIE